MGETAEQIETHIRDARADLSANLNALGDKVKSATDWRRRYRQSPGAFLAVALGGGMLLALMSSRAVPAAQSHSSTPPAPARGGSTGDLLFEAIKGALIAVAASQAKSVLSQLLRGNEPSAAQGAKPHRSSAASDPL
jgi:hypothetical protein